MSTATATMAMPAGMPPDRGDDWITLAEVSRILQRHVNAVKSIALAGFIKTRWMPGSRIQYSRSDATRLVEARQRAR